MHSYKKFSGFIFLNIQNPLVAWECYRGLLISPNYIDTIQQQHPSILLASIIRTNNNENLANELLFEHIRQKEFPDSVSRLRCLYVFADKECVEKTPHLWGGSDNHFDFNYLAEVGIEARKFTKADANWITNAKRCKNGLIADIDQIRNYWKGEVYNNVPHWEYLIEGTATIWGTELRDKAYQEIKNIMPESLGLLEIARVAAYMGSNLGHVHPYIIRLSETKFKLTHIMDMRDATSEQFLNKLKNYNGPKNHNDLKEFIYEGKLCTLDLRNLNKVFSMSEFSLYGFNNMRIHTIE